MYVRQEMRSVHPPAAQQYSCRIFLKGFSFRLLCHIDCRWQLCMMPRPRPALPSVMTARCLPNSLNQFHKQCCRAAYDWHRAGSPIGRRLGPRASREHNWELARLYTPLTK